MQTSPLNLPDNPSPAAPQTGSISQLGRLVSSFCQNGEGHGIVAAPRSEGPFKWVMPYLSGDPDRIRTDDLWLDRPVC